MVLQIQGMAAKTCAINIVQCTGHAQCMQLCSVVGMHAQHLNFLLLAV